MAIKIEQKKKKPRRWPMLVIFICVCCMGFFGYKILSISSEDNQNKQVYEQLWQDVLLRSTEEKQKTNEAYSSPIDFESLTKTNEDAAAWLRCEGTQINFPIVQGNNNEYYLHHSIKDEWSEAGCIFLDYRNSLKFSDMQSVVFGHNFYRKDLMFTSLQNYQNQEYYEKFPKMSLYTPNAEYEIELFCGYSIDAEKYDLKLNYGDAGEFESFLKEAQDKSDFKSKVSPSSTDRIFTMCTCSVTGTDRRYLVHGILKLINGEE
ncbi:MAG: class B sortase [Oscillospiraceae bacterium]